MADSQVFSVSTLSADNYKSSAAQRSDLQTSFAVMQADMDKALQVKRQSSADKANVAGSDDSLLKPVSRTDNKALDSSQLSRVIEMAWEDRTPFAAIAYSYGLSEADVIKLMRQELKPSSFRMWRQRVTGRATKHQAKRPFLVGRAYCQTQYKPR